MCVCVYAYVYVCIYICVYMSIYMCVCINRMIVINLQINCKFLFVVNVP